MALERFPTRKTGALLSLLAFFPNRRHSREELADILWPDADLAAARDRLSQALVWLRPRLEPTGVARGSVLITDRFTVGLNPAAIATDVSNFEAALAAARHEAVPALQIQSLSQAVTLYTGDLLSDYYEEWIAAERQRLRRSYLLALRQLARLYEQAGDPVNALDYARRALATDPLHEEAHADLIRLLAASGQTTEALRHFQELEALLARELGAPPSPVTRSLVEQIRQSNAALPITPAASPPPSSLRSSTRLPALPTFLTRFFGREAEIDRIGRLIQGEGARLVTLTGTGGAGKTRLALAVSTRLTDTYGGAVAFVPLADLEDVRLIPTAIAAALQLPGAAAGSPREQIVEALSARPHLLLLDNLEHLLTGAAPLVRELLEAAPTLTVLATSRQRLGLEGEREVSVPPLSLPAPSAPLDEFLSSTSVQLFVDRAQSVRPDFAVTPANADSVAHLCARLDGIPLAIELCAAWAQTLTPAQMAEMLDQRFDLLVSRRSDIVPRHRTLRAAIEYSYLLLPPDLQRLFTRLSVFRGGWSLEAAAAVCSDTPDTFAGAHHITPSPLSLLDGLTKLRERSLIVADEVRAGESVAAMRYRMLETLRDFAGEQLTYADRVTRRQTHLAYFVQLAEQAESRISGATAEASLTRLDAEQENLRSALAWSLEAPMLAEGLRLGSALSRYWAVRGFLREGYDWLRKLLDGTATQAGETIPATVIAKGWSGLGYLAWSQGDYITARTAHEQALKLRRESSDQAGIAESLYHLGITTYRLEDYAAAREFLDESLTNARARGDQAGIARVLLNLGNIAYEQERHEEARDLFQQSFAIEQALGNRLRMSNILNNLGLVALATKEYAKATTLFEEALTLHREITDNYGEATVLVNLAATARAQGQKEHSRSLLIKGLKLSSEIGNKHIIAYHLLQFGILECSGEAPARGVFLLSGADRLFTQIGSSPGTAFAEEWQQTLTTAHNALGDAAFEAAWTEGKLVTLEQMITRALAF